MRYSIRRNELYFLFKVRNVTIKNFKLLESEHKYIEDFLYVYHLLNDKDRRTINDMRSKYTLYRCWYYARVWYHTRSHNLIMPLGKECIDHIYPISKGLSNNISPELIGSLDNLQFLTLNENLRKNSLITDKGLELYKLFTS